MKLFQANNLGIDKKYSKDYVINGRKSFNFFFIDGLLHLFECDEDNKGRYSIYSISFNKTNITLALKHQNQL